MGPHERGRREGERQKGKRQTAKTRVPFKIKGLKFIHELQRTVRRFAGPSVLARQKSYRCRDERNCVFVFVRVRLLIREWRSDHMRKWKQNTFAFASFHFTISGRMNLRRVILRC